MDRANSEHTKILLEFQQEEIDGAAVYDAIARFARDEKNRRIILRMADDERAHAEFFGRHTGQKLHPSHVRVTLYSLAARVMGYTFAIKLLERGEENIRGRYNTLLEAPEAHALAADLRQVVRDEERHEGELLAILEEERVTYIGSSVLGMNDALVELTGALAGYTFAMQDTRLVSMAGIITGCSATMSMAASEFLSARADGGKNALKSSVYTGIAYLVTVLLLILPYLTLPRERYATALFVTMATAIGIIAFFNWYMSVVLDRSFKKGFLEMAGISVTVAVVSFLIGIAVKKFLGIEL